MASLATASLSVRQDDLPQTPPLSETLQPDALVLFETEILGGAENCFQDVRHQDLLAVGLCHDAGGGIDTGPEKIVSGRIASPVCSPMRTFTGCGRMLAIVAVERALNADGALDGFTRRVECDHEAVAGRS